VRDARLRAIGGRVTAALERLPVRGRRRIALTMVLACVWLLTGCDRGADAPPAPAPNATGPTAETAETVSELEREAAERYPDAVVAVRHFLDTYVSEDGRVTRLEGDTVSEGQAYGLLLTVAVGDRVRFDRLWRWTREHLQREDGLLAWLWAEGEVVDERVAPDADLDAARALFLAAERFDEPSYADDGQRLAAAILDYTTVEHEIGTILTAGEWAATEDWPMLNPSYFSPRAFDLLAEGTGDERWDEVAASAPRVLEWLLDEGEGIRLPPDWAVLAGDRITPSTPPAGEEGPAYYGLDAARVPVRFGVSCREEDRAVAARLWPVLSDLRADGLRSHHYLGGRPSAEHGHPLSHVAAAAAADAAGSDAVDDLLDEAELLDESSPSYYGAAWVALGRVKLTTDLLGVC
jgi:endoglucanase